MHVLRAFTMKHFVSTSFFRSRLLISSSFLYGLAYVCPIYLWWTVIIFLVPLFYLVIHEKITFIDGLLWSTIAIGLQLNGIIQGLIVMADGSFIVSVLPSILMFCLGVGYGVVWFTLSSVLCSFKQTALFRALVWTITTWLFFLWMERCCIFMLGACEGYLLCNPILPLVQFPALLYFLPKMGAGLFLLFFVASQMSIVVTSVYKGTWRYCFILFLCMWGIGIAAWYNRAKSMHDVSALVCGRSYFKVQDNISYNGRIVRDYCKTLLQEHPQAEVILFPETAVRCPILLGEPRVIRYFSQQELGKPISLLIGGFRWDNEKCRNTVYWIHDGELIDIFDKRHAMALIERMPKKLLLGDLLIKKAYFSTMPEIIPNVLERPIWKISQNLTIIPYICSELFFNNSPDHTYNKNAIIAAFCNDDWIKQDQVRYHMVMGARYRAIQWQIPILYIAHYYQALCEPYGAYRALR